MMFLNLKGLIFIFIGWNLCWMKKFVEIISETNLDMQAFQNITPASE